MQKQTDITKYEYKYKTAEDKKNNNRTKIHFFNCMYFLCDLLNTYIINKTRDKK